MVDFMECGTCFIKLGTPILCNSCLTNRSAIERLQAHINRTDIAIDELLKQAYERRYINWCAGPVAGAIDNLGKIREERI